MTTPPLPGPAVYGRGELADYCDRLHSSEQSTFRDPGSGLQVVWRYADVQNILGSPGPAIVNTNSLDPLTPRRVLLANLRAWPSLAYLIAHVRPATANAHGPAHKRVRDHVWHPDDPSSLDPGRTEENYGTLVRAVAGKMADEMITRAAAGPADLAAGFAASMAARVIISVLGLPEESTGKVRAWADAQASLLGQDLRGGNQAAALTALAALARACRDLTGARRAKPRQDLASLLTTPGEDALTEPLAASAAMNLIAAGWITTYGTIVNSAAYLLSGEGRTDWEALDGTAARHGGLVDELLRLETALVGWKRRAARDIVLADGTTVIRAGSPILALMGVANRDPGVFEDPHRIHPGRKGRSLTFGQGVHYCLGKELARLELISALLALRERAPGLAAADPGDGGTYRPDPMFRVRDELLVTVPAGARPRRAAAHA